MRLRRLCLTLLVLLIPGAISTQAQSHEMFIKVVDYKGSPMPQASVCIYENGDNCRMDSGGKVRTILPSGITSNSSIPVFVLNKEYVLIEPWESRIRLPLPSNNQVKVRVFRIGDKSALTSDIVLRNLIKILNYRTGIADPKGRVMIDPRRASLSLVAKDFGFTPTQLEQSLRRRRAAASASEKGQFALLSGNLSEAKNQFLRVRTSASPERKQMAEDDFFLGQTLFQLGEFRKALKAFSAAEALGMDADIRILDYQAQIALVQDDFDKALETFKRSLALREKSLPSSDPDLLELRVRLASLNMLLNKEDEVQDLLQKIWLSCEEALAKDFATTAPALIELMDFYQEIEDDEESDFDFDAEIDWLKELVKTSTENEVQHNRVNDLRARSLVLQILAVQVERDDFEHGRKVAARVLNLLKDLRAMLPKDSRSKSRRAARGSAGMPAQARRRPFVGPASSDSFWAIFPLLTIAKIIPDEKTRTQLFDEAVVLIKATIARDPMAGLVGLTDVMQSDALKNRSDAKRLYELMWTTAEKTSVMENPALADDVFQAAVNYNISNLNEQEIKLLFDRAGFISTKIWGNEHALDAHLFMVLARTLRSLDEDSEQEVRRLLEAPVNKMLANVDGILAAESNSSLALLYFATMCGELGRYEEAKNLYSKILDNLESRWGARHILVGKVLQGIAKVQEAQGLKIEAASTYVQAIEIEKRRLGPKHPLVARLMWDHAETLRELDRAAEAATLFAQSQAIDDEAAAIQKTQWLQKTHKERLELRAQEEKLGQDHPSLVPLLSSLAEAYKSQSNYSEAEVCYKKLVAARRKDPKGDVIELAQGLAVLAAVREELQKYKEAEECYVEGIAILERLVETKAEGSWLVPSILKSFAGLLKRTGREAEAAKIMERIAALEKKD